MIKKAVCYSFSLTSQEPVAYIRLIAPLRQSGIEIINGYQNGQIDEDLIRNCDIVIFQREFPYRFDDYRKIINIARQAKKIIVFDLDDLLFFLPENHPDRRGTYYGPTLLPMFQALLDADLVTVSTPCLKDALIPFNPNIAVLPNYFDEQLWNFAQPGQKDLSSGRLTVGYMGTNSHRPDLEYIAPVLGKLSTLYPEKIKFHFWGVKPPEDLLALPHVSWTSQYFSSYVEFSSFFQAQSVDIFIAPLIDNFFNRCKSPIKFFEYSALGAPGVFSNLEVYSNIVTHEDNGLLAASLDEWFESLCRLIDNDPLRFTLVANAQETIKKNWLLSQNAYQWKDAYLRAIEVDQLAEPKNIGYLPIITSINQHLFDTLNQLDAETQSLISKLEEKDQRIKEKDQRIKESDQIINDLRVEKDRALREIEQLENEILKYLLSKSWRFTRPFRKIRPNIARLLRKLHVQKMD